MKFVYGVIVMAISNMIGDKIPNADTLESIYIEQAQLVSQRESIDIQQAVKLSQILKSSSIFYPFVSCKFNT